VNGSSDTSRTGEAPPVLDDLPPGIAWLRGPDSRLPAPMGAGLPEPRPRQVLTWLPDGRWVTDPDEPEPDAVDPLGETSDAPDGHRRRAGAGWGRGRRSSQRDPGHDLPSGRDVPEHSRRRPGHGGPEPGQRRPEPAELARRWGRWRLRLARIGARLAGWPRRVVIGILLVAAAILALRPDAARAPAPPVGATEHVVVAARDLAAGTELAATDLRIVSVPVEIVPAGSSSRAAGLIGRIAAGAIRRGEPLTDARVVGPGLAAGLGPDESAAVPVRIADPDAAALVRVGDRVDVLGTPVAPDGAQATAGETVTVASAVRVLAVLRSGDPADGVVLVVATGEAAARTLAGAAVRHRLTVNVRSP
jgi:pilus assembly protein CpaB